MTILAFWCTVNYIMKNRILTHPLFSRTRFRCGLLSFALTTLILFMSAAGAGPSAQEIRPAVSLAVLDGHVFEAKIVPEDNFTAPNNAPLIDKLAFDNGLFVSEICTRYDFAPAQYWVRNDDGAIRFYAELRSPTSGRMVWTGAVKDGKLEGTMRWTRQRWYRTIDAQHRIVGQLVPSPAN